MTEQIKRQTHEIDAEGKAVGRIASQVALLLRGKNKATFVPRIDAGDYVVVINAAKVHFSGRKLVQKDYRRHTMHPGGLKRVSMKRVVETDPAKVLRRAVYGMLPKNSHRKDMIQRLTIHV